MNIFKRLYHELICFVRFHQKLDTFYIFRGCSLAVIFKFLGFNPIKLFLNCIEMFFFVSGVYYSMLQVEFKNILILY